LVPKRFKRSALPDWAWAISNGDAAMEKQPIKFANSVIDDMTASQSELAEHISSLTPNDPVIKAGQTVAYDIVQSDTGRNYAINLDVIDNSEMT
jgi:hypothetical protein